MAMVLGVLKKLLIIERPFYKVKKNYQLQRGPTSFKIITRSRHTLLLCHKNKTSFSSMNQFQVICQSIVHPIQKFQDKNFPSQQRNKPASHAITIVYYGLSKIVHSDFRYTEDVFFTEVCSIISFFSLLCTVQGGHKACISLYEKPQKIIKEGISRSKSGTSIGSQWGKNWEKSANHHACMYEQFHDYLKG